MREQLWIVPVLMACAVVLLAGAVPQAEHDEHRHEPPATQVDPAHTLSAELRQLLIKEMQLIDDGMGELLSAISAGDWKTIDAVAGKIQRSFILKQQLTDHQRHELHEKLPPAFVRMDVRFHETAGKLAGTAHRRDAELAAIYYSRLVEGCVSCHASFAARRFPGLAADAHDEHRH